MELLRRKDSLCNKGLSLGDVIRVIDNQTANGCPSSRCIANEKRPVPLHVLGPFVGTRVEQFDRLVRDDTGRTGAADFVGL